MRKHNSCDGCVSLQARQGMWKQQSDSARKQYAGPHPGVPRVEEDAASDPEVPPVSVRTFTFTLGVGVGLSGFQSAGNS